MTATVTASDDGLFATIPATAGDPASGPAATRPEPSARAQVEVRPGALPRACMIAIERPKEDFMNPRFRRLSRGAVPVLRAAAGRAATDQSSRLAGQRGRRADTVAGADAAEGHAGGGEHLHQDPRARARPVFRRPDVPPVLRPAGHAARAHRAEPGLGRDRGCGQGLHPHQQPRGRRRRRHHGDAAGRAQLQGHADRHRSGHRRGGGADQGRADCRRCRSPIRPGCRWAISWWRWATRSGSARR